MKYKKIVVVALFAAMLVSCGRNNGQEEAPQNDSVKSMMEPTGTQPAGEEKFAGVEIANTRDFSCGMPVSAGVEDTAHYKGKVYGFCARECKEDFLKNPEQYLTTKK
ncbi:MAG: YHS domain-containing protein [Ferruginibacter sp.]|nr:YHS domain-containing protein [Chitinophagaceae bacterium]MBP6285335.1 YHS domain-containing protein [Ferruginibacter sp.]MBU9935824.1 YHS domain-containing protein [Ferruginibacter sp.]